MRLRFALLVAVTTVLTVLSPTAVGPAHAAPAHSPGTDWAYVNRQLYEVSLSTFLVTAAGGTGDRWFDWSTDFCSAPMLGNTGVTYDFRGPCRRHDFGYRNLRLLDRRYGAGHWTSANRRRVDLQFLADMRAHCARRSLWLQPTCRWWAQTYYAAVRLWGGR